MDIIETILGAIIQIVVEKAIGEVEKEKIILSLKRRFGFEALSHSANFDSCYSYALIEYGVGKPKVILDVLGNEVIRNAFRDSFENDNPEIFNKEIEEFLQWHPTGDELRKMDADIRSELIIFKTIFDKAVLSTRSPLDIHQDRELSDIKNILKELVEKSKSNSSVIELKTNEIQLQRKSERTIIPFLPSYFVRRNEIIDSIKKLIEEKVNKYPLIININGIGGSGKTLLVRALVGELLSTKIFSTILWATLGSTINETDLFSILDDWAIQIGVDPNLVSNIIQKVALIRHSMEGHKVILVIDNVWDIESVKLLLGIRVDDTLSFITTRDNSLSDRLDNTIPVNLIELSKRESYNLIETRIGKSISNATEKKEIDKFISRINHHPLTISLASAQVSAGQSTWKELNDLLDKHKLLDQVGYSNALSSEESIKLSLNLSVKSMGDQLVRCFSWLATMAPDSPFYTEDAAMVWSPIIQNDLDEFKSPNEKMKFTREFATKVLNQLYSNGLLEASPNSRYGLKSYFIHPLIRELALGILDEKGEMSLAFTHHAWVYFSLAITSGPFPDDNFPYIQNQLLEVLERAWSSISADNEFNLPKKDFPNSLIIGVVLRFGNLWKIQGQNQLLVKWGHRALSIAQSLKNEDEIRILLRYIGNAYSNLNQAEKAIEYYKKSREISENRKENLEIAVDISLIANGFTKINHMLDEAIRNYNQALEIIQNHNNPSMEGVIFSNLGKVYSGKNEFNKAKMYLDKSIQKAEEINDPIALSSRIGSLGYLSLQEGHNKYQEALFYLHKSKRIARQSRNKSSEAIQLVRIGRTYASLYKFKTAKLYFEEAEKFFKETNSPYLSELRQDLLNLTSGLDDDVNFFLPEEMLEFTLDACLGDEIAKSQLIPFLEKLVLNKASIGIADFAKSLLSIVNGERDAILLVKDLLPEYSLMVQVDLFGIMDFQFGVLMFQLSHILPAFLKGDMTLKERLEKLKVSLEQQKVFNEQITGSDSLGIVDDILIILSKILYGERDIEYFNSVLKDEKIRLFVQTIFKSVDLN